MSEDERLIHEQRAEFGPLSVTESGEGRRSLWFGRGRVCQGVVELGRIGCVGMPYVAVAIAALSVARGLDRVLVVGLGAGVLPRFLHAHLPRTQIDVVEIDPVVVAVAERFFEFETDAHLRVHVADGRDYLASCDARHDAIILDGHGLHEVPSQLSTPEFLATTRAALRPGGVVVANVWGEAGSRHHECTLAKYRDAFAQVHVLDVDTLANKILLALPEPLALNRERLVAQARAFSIEHGFPIDLGDHVQSPIRSAR
ncbi:spermidine synthase [Nannocystaceae bacterium ST9]